MFHTEKSFLVKYLIDCSRKNLTFEGERRL